MIVSSTILSYFFFKHDSTIRKSRSPFLNLDYITCWKVEKLMRIRLLVWVGNCDEQPSRLWKLLRKNNVSYICR